jgi:hypothetical protein
MTQANEEWTAHEAYEHMVWCEATVKKLRELSEEEALSWWENDCQKPDWLEIQLEGGESIHSFADRLEQEEFEWAETASVRCAEEKAAEEEHKKEARRALERGINWKRYRLEDIRFCQKTSEADRMVRSFQYGDHCGYIYLMKQVRAVRRGNSLRLEGGPESLHKIGATMRPFKMRSKELWRERLLSVCKYATAVPFELEKALHLHFDEFRIKRGKERQKGQRKNTAGETFKVPLPEVETFKETVAKVEKWVLLSVEAELELEIFRAEAILARSEAAKDVLSAASPGRSILQPEGPPPPKRLRE